MNKIHFVFALILFIVSSGFTQNTAPPGIPYQAIARNANGTPYVNANLSVRFSLHEQTATGTVSYAETKSLQTNDLGLFSTTFGSGTPITGTFAAIDWAQTTKFLQVEINLGSAWVDLGTQQLMSVPYAMYAASSGIALSNIGSIHKIGFSSSTTWTCPEGVNQIIVELWGGSGGGNSVQIYPLQGQSGGDGGYNKQIVNVVPGQSYSIIIGNAGGAAYYQDINSGAGGISSFNNLFFAEGGAGTNGPVGKAPNGQVVNYSYTNAGYSVGSRTYIPTGYVVNEPGIAVGGAGGIVGTAQKPGESGYCIITYIK